MPDALTLSAQDLDLLASGRATSATLDVLVASQRSKRRLLLLALRRAAGPSAPSGLDDAFALLAAADAAAPAAVGRILARPWINVWAIRCLRELLHAGGVCDGPGDSARSDAGAMGFLRGVAASAAAVAGLDFEITLPAPAGVVFLPGLGTAAGLGEGPAVVRGKADRLEVVGRDGTVPRGGTDSWIPSRSIQLGSGQPWTLQVEDQDPYRDCYGWRPAARLSEVESSRLARLLAAAWTIVESDYPGYAPIVRRTLTAVVPLADGGAVSAASQLAYGSVAVSIPPDADTLVQLLLHEVQHMTLGAIMDLVDLCRPDATALHHAPWRMDPRPVGPLLQGTFAHLGVTDYWRIRRLRDDPGQQRAAFEFAYWREMATRATETLQSAGELTSGGSRIVAGVGAALARMAAEAVPADVSRAVGDIAAANTVLWRLRNQRPAGAAVAALGRQYLAGHACVGLDGPRVRPGPPVPARHHGLADQIRQHLLAEPAGGPATPGDRAFLAGDLGAAAGAYRVAIEADPTDDDAWVGLAMAVRGQGDDPAAFALMQRPDLVRALYQLCADTAPTELARWMASGLGPPARPVQGEGGSI